MRNVEVVTVGHAIVDVLAHVEDRVVADLGLGKGTMTLVDEEDAARIHAALDSPSTVSGGSAANTAVGLASFGRHAAFVGKVRDDRMGEVYAAGLRDAGVELSVPPALDGPATGRCVVLVTPDAEKTMCTSLGIGDLLGPADVDSGLVARSSVVYLEGYLCGLPHTDATVRAVLDAAAGAGTAVALSLSDPLWVQLHGPDLAALLPQVAIVFANEAEACGLTGATDVDGAVDALADRCETVVVTLGAAGCVAARGRERVRVPAVAVPSVVDTTGAGDSFAAGFLHGLLGHDDLEVAARLGAVAAAEVVGHLGARPLVPLCELALAAGLGLD